MSHRSRSKCSSKPDCKCFKCCEPPPQCKVIECPAVTCVVGEPDPESNKPLGTIALSILGKAYLLTEDGWRELALVPLV